MQILGKIAYTFEPVTIDQLCYKDMGWSKIRKLKEHNDNVYKKPK